MAADVAAIREFVAQAWEVETGSRKIPGDLGRPSAGEAA
jgi:hypothetical protein